MAHELQIMPKSKNTPQEKPQESSCPTASHALSNQQEKEMKRMTIHGSSSEEDDDDDDDDDDEDSSSDEEVNSMVAMYVKKIFKYVKKINMYGYNVHLREGVDGVVWYTKHVHYTFVWI
jgi:hypothetical protein